MLVVLTWQVHILHRLVCCSDSCLALDLSPSSQPGSLIVSDAAAIVSPLCAIASGNKDEQTTKAIEIPGEGVCAESSAPLAPSSPMHRSHSEEASEHPGKQLHPEDGPSPTPSPAAHLRESPQMTPRSQQNLELPMAAGIGCPVSSSREGNDEVGMETPRSQQNLELPMAAGIGCPVSSSRAGDDEDGMMEVDILLHGSHSNEDLHDDFPENNSGNDDGHHEEDSVNDDAMHVDSDPIIQRPRRSQHPKKCHCVESREESEEVEEEDLDVSPDLHEVIDVDLYASMWEPTKTKVSIFPSSFSALIGLAD
jgi:hypothetical protein